MTKLHQILPVEKSTRATTQSEIDRAYHDAQKAPLFNGLTRTYTARDDADNDRQPPERKIVQLTTDDILAKITGAFSRQLDVIATKNMTNLTARGDVSFEGRTLLADVPATTLLTIEKALKDIHTIVLKLPVLDPEVEWVGRDEATGLWKSSVERTVRTKKVPKAFVKAEATDRHPAQVDTFTEDQQVGDWAKTLFSGAMPAPDKLALIRRVEGLQAAVKMAREAANQADVIDHKVGAVVMSAILGTA